ncbi:hypothetical protein K458DRAFT_200878 [Lentithecium fluviatile CBS 122367]|uniref:Uncharacterized protein n=1 Tax=Lentithecium fluviatile CBS 122367 TaxID=1168545 RepID=A0A6G1J8Y7_9PLEO|nr:hypothetical protein K458DRAFT_200878 [Lentithecium fluviatile CBS 122367]
MQNERQPLEMEAWTRRVFLVAFAVVACASPAPTAEPAITPAAILPRADSSILGWYSSATIGSETIYAPWAYDAETTTYTTSGSWFRRCPVSTSCTMYTSCSNGYMMAEGTSSYCGAGGASGSLFCSNHILYTSLGQSAAKSWYWCDEAPLTGVTFYEQEPSQPTDTSSRSFSSDASTTIAGGETTSRSGSATASGAVPSPTSTQSSSGGSSTNVGAIAGGVVGGVVGLALIGAGIFLLYRRKKKSNAAASQAPTGYAPPPNQPRYPASPNTGLATAYQANEAKPQGVQEMGGYYNQPPAPYPQGPYDPHMSQYGGSQAPQEVPSPQPQYAAPQPLPQEMPTTTTR